jgi:8-oxo-dGTP diphosphatase
MLYLVRHAKAGSRHDWVGDDLVRPLSKAGRKQADALAASLRAAGATELYSSPYVRCVQTLEPLGAAIGVPVVVDARLTEGDDFSGAVELLATARDGAVLCSHGDLIPATIAALERRGCVIIGEPDWRKATVWVIQREDGDCVSANVWGPPEV